MTPQFERQDGQEPSPAPASREDFEALREMSGEELEDLGLRPWDGDLYLFPGEWYDEIPEDFTVETILGETEPFSKDTCSRDIRFGCLAYGVMADG